MYLTKWESWWQEVIAVVLMLKTIQNRKDPRLERIPIELLKNAPKSVSEMFAWFPQSDKSKEVSYEWKQANITLLYIKNDHKNARIIVLFYCFHARSSCIDILLETDLWEGCQPCNGFVSHIYWYA